MIEWNGERLSKLCLGTVQFGMNYGVANQNGRPQQTEVNRILDYVQQEGVNCFDTAQLYGESEAVLGNYLLEHSARSPLIVTKIPSSTFILETDALIDSVKQSCMRLQRAKLYGLLMHDATQLASWSASDSAKVLRLKEEGLIAHFGVSIYSDAEFHLALGNPLIEMIQIPYNLFDQRGSSKGWFELARQHNKLIFIRSVYLQGLLLMAHESVPHYLDAAKPFIQKLETFCRELGMTRNELCLAFVNTTAPDAPLLFGCETLIQAEENIETFAKARLLSSDEIAALATAFSTVDETLYNPAKWKRS